jgi:hypothetical protein
MDTCDMADWSEGLIMRLTLDGYIPVIIDGYLTI